MQVIKKFHPWISGFGLVGLLWMPVTECEAVVISAGDPTINVPAYVGVTLSVDQFLLPIIAIGAEGLHEWQFDLVYDSAVVRFIDLGGFYQGIFAPTTLS